MTLDVDIRGAAGFVGQVATSGMIAEIHFFVEEPPMFSPSGGFKNISKNTLYLR
jgi:hypothetical protein